MALLWTDSHAAARTAGVLVLAGAAAGTVGPRLAQVADPILAPVVLSLTLVLAGWFARSGRVASPARLLIGGASGLLAALCESLLPAGLALAVFGLGLGVALAPTSLRRWREALASSLPSLTAVLALGVVAGALLQLSAITALSAATQWAGLGALLALGLAAGEASRGIRFVSEEPPAWIDGLLEDCGAGTRPVLLAAIDARRRVVRSLLGESIDAGTKSEGLTVADDLLTATAKAVRTCDEAERAMLGLSEHAGALEGHAELLKARARIRDSLQEKARTARTQAGEHAASLTRMAATLSAGGPRRSAPVEPPNEEPTARAQGVRA